MDLKFKKIWYLFSLIISILFFIDPLSPIIDRKIIIMLSDIIFILIVLFMLFYKYQDFDIRGKIGFFFLLISIAIMLIYFIERGINKELLGVKTVLNFTIILLYSSFFEFEKYLTILCKTIGYLLIASLIFIVLEYYMQTQMNFLPVFTKIWEGSGYRSDTQLMLYFPYIINGPIFGSQNASILCVMALFYSVYTYKGIIRIILSIVSLVCLYWSFKITAIFSIIASLLIISYTYKNKLWKIIRFAIFFMIIFIPYIIWYLMLVKANFDPTYLSHNIYTEPIVAQFIDTLKVFWKFPFGTSFIELYIEHADISILTILIRFGYVFLTFFLIISIYSIIRLIKCVGENDNDLRLVIIYLVILLVSVIHYPTLLTPGILHIYVAFLSLGIINKDKMKNMINKV